MIQKSCLPYSIYCIIPSKCTHSYNPHHPHYLYVALFSILELLTSPKMLFTRQHNSTATMINGVKWHDHAQLGLESLDQLVVLAFFSHDYCMACTCHALAKHLASARNSILWNKAMRHAAVSKWSLWACRKICWFIQKVIRQSCSHVNRL